VPWIARRGYNRNRLTAAGAAPPSVPPPRPLGPTRGIASVGRQDGIRTDARLRTEAISQPQRQPKRSAESLSKLQLFLGRWDAIANSDLPKPVKDVMLCLLRHANWDTGLCWPTIKRIQRQTGYKSDRTVSPAIAKARTMGLLFLSWKWRGDQRHRAYALNLKRIDELAEPTLFDAREGDETQEMRPPDNGSDPELSSNNPQQMRDPPAADAGPPRSRCGTPPQQMRVPPQLTAETTRSRCGPPRSRCG
jgi:hypothetical protein